MELVLKRIAKRKTYTIGKLGILPAANVDVIYHLPSTIYHFLRSSWCSGAGGVPFTIYGRGLRAKKKKIPKFGAWGYFLCFA